MGDSTDAVHVQSVLLVGADVGPGLTDQPALRSLCRRALYAQSVSETWRMLGESSPDLVVLGQDIDPDESLQFVRKSRQQFPQTPVVVLSDAPSADWAVRFIRAGAYDYVAGESVTSAMQRLLEEMKSARASADSDEQRFFCDECPPGVAIAGRSEGLAKTLSMIRLIAQSRCNPVLILGDTGTGKELAARAVHAWRHGTGDRFVAVNCAALTANLLESELFGHVKGAFTGADRDKTGLFEAARGGSLFLDEISEMAPELQAKLLRVVQERTFRKVGGTQDIASDATIIASSNRDLLQDVDSGKFRRDLYYRLAVFPIRIPALSDASRRDDIPLMAEFFLRQLTNDRSAPLRLSQAAADLLRRHPWRGNVRELRNVMERAAILEVSDEVSPQSLIFDAPAGESPAAEVGPKDFSLEAAEREFILRALKETNYQRTRAAMLLGITRATLHAKLKRYDIKIPSGVSSDAAEPVGEV